jgi:hypothetical protein
MCVTVSKLFGAAVDVTVTKLAGTAKISKHEKPTIWVMFSQLDALSAQADQFPTFHEQCFLMLAENS